MAIIITVTEAVVQERSERLFFWKISRKLLGTTYNITKIASFRWFLWKSYQKSQDISSLEY